MQYKTKHSHFVYERHVHNQMPSKSFIYLFTPKHLRPVNATFGNINPSLNTTLDLQLENAALRERVNALELESIRNAQIINAMAIKHDEQITALSEKIRKLKATVDHLKATIEQIIGHQIITPAPIPRLGDSSQQTISTPLPLQQSNNSAPTDHEEEGKSTSHNKTLSKSERETEESEDSK